MSTQENNINENFIIEFGIKRHHEIILDALRNSVSSATDVSPQQIVYNLSINSFASLAEDSFDGIVFLFKLEEILNISIFHNENLTFHSPYPTKFFGFTWSCYYLYLGDWFYWFIYNYLKYARIGLNETGQNISGREYLDLFASEVKRSST